MHNQRDVKPAMDRWDCMEYCRGSQDRLRDQSNSFSSGSKTKIVRGHERIGLRAIDRSGCFVLSVDGQVAPCKVDILISGQEA